MDTFLFELGCEELPPKALPKLEKALADSVRKGLASADLSFTSLKSFAAPRRLAFIIKDLPAAQQDQSIEKFGPSEAAAFDDNGKPSKAAVGFARSCNTDVADLQLVDTDKGKRLFHAYAQKGKSIHELMPIIIKEAITQLPIPKPMRWGDNDTLFVRPVHWVVMMYGSEVVPANILGLPSGKASLGHRFMQPGSIEFTCADEYEEKLQKNGFVIADFTSRRQNIHSQIKALADQKKATALIADDLLDEVTAIVEWPVALMVSFDSDFLKVPAEALIASMQDHQKCFALYDKDNKLLPNFITVSNIASKDPQQVIAGNQRVMRARLSDAAFFYEADCQHALKDLLPRLHTVTFQNKLGSLFDKAQRLAAIARHLAEHLGFEKDHAERAGWLAKCDLLTQMVGEFPELQGVMGKYYAQNSKEEPEVALAICQHYYPRFAKDDLPSSTIGLVLAIAERLDNLVGIFGIGQIPTGDKDPFALRRAALGLVRLITENKLALDLVTLLEFVRDTYQVTFENQNVISDVHQFILDRMKVWIIDDERITTDTFAAVIDRQNRDLFDTCLRLDAVSNFRQLEQASALAAANKRVSKILIKESKQDLIDEIQPDLLQIDAEKKLAQMLLSKQKVVTPLFADNRYKEALQELAELREPVDSFFDNVMVMVEQEDLRNNRLALLNQLHQMFLKVADISLLQG